jgi:hypothetical protein
MVKAQLLPKVQFAFQGNKTRPDKLRGLVEFGPFQQIRLGRPPCFGFVFPEEQRSLANQLFLALKNGIGAFKGVEATFRFPLSKDQVFPISGFSVQGLSHHDAARKYADAILSWRTKQSSSSGADMFVVLHPQTSRSDLDTPYYACKARLLQEGILSQNVTFELIRDEAKLRWSAANIALGAFVKLGGIPWVVYGDDVDQDLIIGLGRAFLYDSLTRQTTGYMGFTACFSARGVFKFVALAEVTDDHSTYLRLLQRVVGYSLQRAEQMGKTISSLTLHIPKEMSKDENRAISEAVDSHHRQNIVQIQAVKISEEGMFFVVDNRFRDGIPPRGTVLQVSDRDYLLYTEGRDEKESWGGLRSPVGLRVTPQKGLGQSRRLQTALRQINDLSQVNWRGFNARSQPISVYYGTLIARLLSHIPVDAMKNSLSPESRRVLEDRLWFI